MFSGQAPSRRAVTRALVAGMALAGLGSVAGCGLRLEQDAPDVPFVPSPRPYPAAAALQAEMQRVRTAEDLSRQWGRRGGPALAAAVAELHTAQARVLHQRLIDVGEMAEPSPSPTASPAANVLAQLRTAEAAALTGGDLAGLPRDDRLLLAACHTSRAAIARAVGARVPGMPRSPHPGSAKQAAQMLGHLQPLVYALQVAAAVAVSDRRRAATARASVAALIRQQRLLTEAAGDQAPRPELGYRLPRPVRTVRDADLLARAELTRAADLWVTAVAETQDATPTTLLAWARETEWWRHAWGASLRALPGMPPAVGQKPNGSG